MRNYFIEFGEDEIRESISLNQNLVKVVPSGDSVRFDLSKGGISIFWKFAVVENGVISNEYCSDIRELYVAIGADPRALDPGKYGSGIMFRDPKGGFVPVARANLVVHQGKASTIDGFN